MGEFKQLVDQEERLHREIILYAEKGDITEEIARLHSHIIQLKKILRSDDNSIGKNIDFYLQEMNREMNTIAAKSDDLEISKYAISMKSELEKIREQAQNIE